MSFDLKKFDKSINLNKRDNLKIERAKQFLINAKGMKQEVLNKYLK
jgi:hypothetical protein